MYHERKDTFSFKDILIQLVLVVLFVFLMMWIFPSKKTVYKTTDNYSSRIFAENISSMKEAGKSYFTKSNLPKTIDKNEKITLATMLEKKLVVPFNDGNGNQCEANDSYVEVTKKTESEYSMKVYLSCTDDVDYVIDNMGQYSYCQTTICEPNTDNNEVVIKDKETLTGTNKETVKEKEVSKAPITETQTNRTPIDIECHIACLIIDWSPVPPEPPIECDSKVECCDGDTYETNPKWCPKPPVECDSKVECCDGDTYETNPKWCPKPPIVCDSKVECCDGDTYETNPKWCPKPAEPNYEKRCVYKISENKQCVTWNNWSSPIAYISKSFTNNQDLQEEKLSPIQVSIGAQFAGFNRTKPIYYTTNDKLIRTVTLKTCSGYSYYVENNTTYAYKTGATTLKFEYTDTTNYSYCPTENNTFKYKCVATDYTNCRDCITKPAVTVDVYRKVNTTTISSSGTDIISKSCNSWTSSAVKVYGKDTTLIGYQPIWTTKYVTQNRYRYKTCKTYNNYGTQSSWGNWSSNGRDNSLERKGYYISSSCETRRINR